MITKFIIKNFRKFTNKEVTFEKGLNIIVGKNESGKSTLMKALLTALYVDVDTRSKKFFNEVSNWKSSSENIFLELNLNNASEQYQLVKDFASKSQKLRNLSTGKSADSFEAINKALASKLKIPKQEVFESTSFVRQAEIAQIQFGKDLRAALQRVSALSNEGQDIEIGIENLDKELAEMRVGLLRPSHYPGILKATLDALEQKKQLLAEKKGEWIKLAQAEEKGGESSGRLEETKKKITEIEQQLENYKKLEAASKDLERLNKEISAHEKTLAQVREQSMQIKHLQAEIETLGIFAKGGEQVNKASDRLVELKKEIQILQEQTAELGEELTKIDVKSDSDYYKKDQAKTNQTLVFISGTVLLIIGIALIALAQVESLGFLKYLAIVFFIIGVPVLVFSTLGGFLNMFGLFNSEKSAAPQKVDEAEFIQSQILQKKQLVAARIKEQQQIASSFGTQDLNEFFTKRARYNTLQHEVGIMESSIKGNLGGEELKAIEDNQAKLLSEKKELEVNVLTPEVRAADLSPNEYLKTRRELDMLLIEQKRLEKDTTKSEVISEISDTSIDDIVALEEELEVLEARLKSLQEREKVLDLTTAMLKQVIKTTSKSVNNVISEQVEEYLPKLTLDRYKDLRIDENYNLQVFSSEKNDWVDPTQYLSLGAMDQIFFLSRVALAKSLLGGQLNYLFLDDPFVSFDSERLEQTKAILQELAVDTQILLFTHNDLYRSWGNVVEL